MNLKESQIEVLKMLAQNENVVAKLYKTYAEKFPDYEGFWSKLAGEEKEHASWIQALYSKIKEGSVHFNEGRFKIEAIKWFQDYLNGELLRTRKEKMRLINALSTAFDVEKALIERKYFEIYEGDSVELKHVFRALATATKDHRDRVEKLWAEKR